MKFQPNQKILAACLIVCSIACNSHSDTSATTATIPAEQKYSGPTNKDVYDAINNSNWTKLDSLISKDAVDHSPMGVINSLDSIKAMLKEFKAGFPDLKMEAMDEAIAGDIIFTRYHWTGTNTGMMNGMPGTNKKVEVTGVDLSRTKDGKLVEHWDYSDNLSFYKQLGVDPLAPPPSKKK